MVAMTVVNGNPARISAVTTAQDRRVWTNYIINPDGSGTDDLSIPGSDGENTVTIRQFDYDNEQMDVDGSGRFNAADAGALALLIGSTDPLHVPRWDFNGNGVIDEEDLADMNALIDAGLQGGLFGDRNRDGSLTCADLSGVDAHFPSALGDTNYLVELDENLDGVLTAVDRGWVYVAVLPGDLNADKSVSIADLTILTSAFGTCIGDGGFNQFADLNRDNCVGMEDLSILLSQFGQSCP